MCSQQYIYIIYMCVCVCGMADMPDSNFELLSRDYIHFRTNIPGIGLVLWYMNHCRLFNAKSICIYINISISNNLV